MTEEILKALYDWNPWFEGDFPEELAGHPRNYDLEPYLQIPEIKILEGARRGGKSTMLYPRLCTIFRVRVRFRVRFEKVGLGLEKLYKVESFTC